jgi:hypothetical protein
MESRRQLDTARRPCGSWAVVHSRLGIRARLQVRVCVGMLASFVSFCGILPAQNPSPTTEQIQSLATAQRWDEIVRLLGPLPARSADMDYHYGSALAHLDRLPEAEAALRAGRRIAPSDSRFPTELAGIQFKQKHYPQAAHLLRQALRLAPTNEYANDFLATVYFLEGNVPAALLYWNRIGKPKIIEVRKDPLPRVDAALLDHAFAFSPAATLKLAQFYGSDARIRGLAIFPQYQVDLRAREDGDFDIDFRNQELNGFGNTKLEALLTFFRELPFQAVTPEYDNFRHLSINFTSLVRWDAQKRRVFADLSAPFEHSAKYRLDFNLDLRDENWALRNGFSGPAPTLASLNLRRELGTFSIASYAGDRLRWNLGAEISHRDYRGVVRGPELNPQLLAAGYQLKQKAQVSGAMLRLAERRFALEGDASSQAARLWSQPGQSFLKLQGSLKSHWFPQAEGDDYEMQQSIRAGKTLGQVPFDELFMLGLERDNDLPMRAHIGTRDGRKGSAPLGRNYFLTSWEGDKNLYRNGLMTVKLGPFLDIGNIADPGTALGSHKWLFDTGAQVKLRVFSTTVAFSYGKDLRTGNNAYYVTLLR